ncbi:MAG: oligosaccharide flippase family protein [Clostridium perfringens]|nr:oligosaccharide flippase family protein [Clostridium perfringens]MDU6175740.1 oligosaccharide flippase family protein [Clostridium perfringens]
MKLDSIKYNKNILVIMGTYSVKVISSLLKFYITWILAKNLINPIEYGNYSYFLTLVNYIILFIGLGINSSLMNIVANEEFYELEDIKGTGYIMNIGLAILQIGVMSILTIWIKELRVNIFIIILSTALIFFDYINRLSIAERKIKLIAFAEFVISLIISFLFTVIKSNYEKYLFIYFLIYMIICNFIIFKFIRVSFKNIKYNFKLIIRKIKEYGFNIYIGRIASMGTYDLDKIMLKSSAGVEYVGFYNLGLSLINPIVMFPDALMSLKYKEMAKNNKLSKKIIIINYMWLIIVGIAFITIGKIIFRYLFNPEYYVLLNYFYLFSILAFLKGSYLPMNNFLSAHNKGHYLRNAAFILAGANIILNLLLIPKLKLVGALFATIIALILNNLTHYYYYYITVKENKCG